MQSLRVAELEQKLAATVEQARLAGAGEERGKLSALSQMLREQQEELTEGYRFSATIKLVSTLDQRRRMDLSAALGSWRIVCMSLAAALREAEEGISPPPTFSDDAHEAMAARVADVELMLEHRKTQAEELLVARDAFEKAAAHARRDAEERTIAAQAASAEAAMQSLRVAELEQKLAATVEQARLAGAGEERGKLSALSQMLREQQEELTEGYRFSATIKLVSTLDQRRRMDLSAALGSWRTYSLVGNIDSPLDYAVAERALRMKVESLAHMLRDQQHEVSERARLLATHTIASVLEQRRRSALVVTLHGWRATCISFALHELDVQLRRATKESRSMALLVSDLEVQLTQLRSGQVEVVKSSQKDARQLPKLPLPHSTSLSRLSPPHAGSRPGSPKPASPVTSSPGSLLNQQLESAVTARSSSPARSTSPPTSLSRQLQEALESRSRRSSSGLDQHQPSAGNCEFCGMYASKNVVRCVSCSHCYHIRCLSSSQASRFKGRRWWCDNCMAK